MTNDTRNGRVEREARLRWVRIEQMRVSPVAQRELNAARVDRLAADFDLEQLGTPTVNERDGHFFILDGQHRIEALRKIGWGDQQIQCWTYSGLTEEQEAERFLRLNDVLAVRAYDKFRVAVTAGRPLEVDVERTVRAQGLRIGQDGDAIGCVATLCKVYRRADANTLGRALRVIRDAYGDAGMEAVVIDGIGHLCQRYNGQLDEPVAVRKLSSAHGGVNGLLAKAELLRKQTGTPRAHCVAAAAVEIINSGRGGKKLPSWWRPDTS